MELHFSAGLMRSDNEESETELDFSSGLRRSHDKESETWSWIFPAD